MLFVALPARGSHPATAEQVRATEGGAIEALLLGLANLLIAEPQRA